MTIETDIKATKKMDLTSKTVINLLYTSRYIETRMGQFKSMDLTMPQYNVLRILRGQKGVPANLSTIQERMIDKNSNTTRLVDKLISKGWVQRSICSENRRKVEIVITIKGLELLEALDPITERTNAELLKNLNRSEQETLNLLLDKLRAEA